MSFQYPYISWLTIFVFIPSIILWIIYFDYYKKYWKVFKYVIIGSFIWGICFDLVGSPLWHVWSYSNTLEYSFLHLPLEEYLILLTFPQEVVCILLLLRRKLYD